MRFASTVVSGLKCLCFLGVLSLFNLAHAQSNVTIRVMAANITSGTGQSYETAGINIFQGLKPDIVAIQEFRYNSSSTSNSLRTLVDTAFGTNYTFFCQSGFNIPNGIVSRYPILASGSWTDPLVSDRSFAWAQIDLPGTNDLYVVSVHLYSSGTEANRNTEALVIKTNIQATFPTNAWVIVGGDFNTGMRSEAAVTTFKTFLSDSPIPDDGGSASNGTPDQDTNEPRNKPYDYVLPSFSLTNCQVPSVIGSRTFTNGLVFDSAVYWPLSDVSPVTSGDSHVSGMQHMAVIKDFSIPVPAAANTAPGIVTAPQSLAVSPGNSATFSVTASGSSPLNYQWLFNGTNVSGATTNPFTILNVQSNNAGNYSVVVTNLYGSITSAIAVLTVTNAAPVITTNPAAQSVTVGGSATFSVSATGTAPLYYQWLFNGANISGATTNPFVLANAQSTNAGNYSVIVSNFVGSVTSTPAALTVISNTTTTSTNIIVQWNFNSVTPDGTNTTGTTLPSIGNGTASLVGGTAANGTGFAGGDPTLDPAGTNDNSAWNTTTYPSSTSANKTAGVQFTVSTAGRQNIVISFSSQASNTGSKYGRLQYTTNGTDYVDFPTAFTNATSFTAKTNSLVTIPGVNNNANFAIRIVAEFESTATGSGSANYVAANTSNTYGTSGTVRFDMITVYGSPIVTVTNSPALPPVISTPNFSAGQFQLPVTGTTGSNYVVQAATNIADDNWIAVFTNAAPFVFIDTNLNAPQKFYRVIVAP